MSDSYVPVAILGAGLTGLSTAERLERRGVEHVVYEKAPRVGGLASTREEAGYRFDNTGHLLHVRSPELRQDVLEWLEGDCLEITRRSRVWSHGVYTRYPFQANTFGLPPAVAYECVYDFVRAYQRRKPDRLESFEEFCRVHFGDAICRHFMLPYNRRLWGVDPRDITAEWCQRFVPVPRLEDVIGGAVGLNDRELGYNAEFIYPRRGIGELAFALQRRAGRVELLTAPRHVRWRTKELVFEGGNVRYDALVSSLPLPVLLDLFEELPSEVQGARARLRCTSLRYLDIALSRPVGRDFHWVYVPEERYPFYRVGCYSHFSEHMAPAGCAGLYVELVDRAPPVLETLMPRVVHGLQEMGLLRSAADVAFVRPRHIEWAYVIYDRHHAEALRSLQAFLESVGVISTGRYGGWNYSSMEDAISFGRTAAERATELLT